MNAKAQQAQLEILLDIQARLKRIEKRSIPFVSKLRSVDADDLRDACDIVGISLTALRAKSRDAWLIEKRRRVVQILHTEGYTFSQIDKALHRQHGCAANLLGLKKRKANS